jgi:riboflavin kinase/FMN adenylyltransferase
LDNLLIIPFTKQFAQQTGEEFISHILHDALQTEVLVIGYDHRFGHNRSTGFEQLRAIGPNYGFVVEEISPQDVEHIAVSSTAIRKALAIGDADLAAKYLGKPYRFSGKVIHGMKEGRKLGYPTANLEIASKWKLLPADGVYAVIVWVDGQPHKAMLSKGNRPTFDGFGPSIEVHLLDYNADLYGKIIEVDLFRWVRWQQKFNSIAELISRINQDAAETRQLLA